MIVVALLVVEVMLHRRRGDPIGTCIQVAELQFPDRQHAQSLAAEHADIDLATVDILLDDRIGADLLVDEGDALRQLLVVVHQRGLGDTERGVLAETLHDQREGEPGRAFDRAGRSQTP